MEEKSHQSFIYFMHDLICGNIWGLCLSEDSFCRIPRPALLESLTAVNAQVLFEVMLVFKGLSTLTALELSALQTGLRRGVLEDTCSHEHAVFLCVWLVMHASDVSTWLWRVRCRSIWARYGVLNPHRGQALSPPSRSWQNFMCSCRDASRRCVSGFRAPPSAQRDSRHFLFWDSSLNK